MTQISRKHHFTSACYLARFTDTGTEDGRLCVFDLVADRFFQQRPKNVAYELDFNRVEIEGHAPDVLEKAFGEFEGRTASVIERICFEGRLPEDEELSFVLNLITLFAVRNPANRRSMTIARQHERRVIADLLASDRGLYEHHLQQARDAGLVSGTEVLFEQMQDSLRNDDHPIEISPQEHLQTELAAFKNLLASVSSQYWSLLIAAPGAPDFITCDHPASLVYNQLVFPLDTRRAVMGDRDHRASRPIIVEAAGVADVNSRMLRLAERQVYSRTPEVALLEDGKILNVDLSATHRLRG